MKNKLAFIALFCSICLFSCKEEVKQDEIEQEAQEQSIEETGKSEWSSFYSYNDLGTLELWMNPRNFKVLFKTSDTLYFPTVESSYAQGVWTYSTAEVDEDQRSYLVVRVSPEVCGKGQSRKIEMELDGRAYELCGFED